MSAAALPFKYCFCLCPADCVPVWYDVNGGYVREATIFTDFYAESDTSSCLAFECPSCHSETNSECVKNLFCVSSDVGLSFTLVFHLHSFLLSSHRAYERDTDLAF